MPDNVNPTDRAGEEMIGDAGLLGDQSWNDHASISADAAGRIAAAAPPASPVSSAAFAPFAGNGSAGDGSGIDLLLDVALDVSVELGRTRLKIREILDLRPGSVVELDKLAGEPADILVNGTLIARGEVVVIDDKFGVRVTEVVSQARRLATIG